MAYRQAAQSREVTPSDEDWLEEYKSKAYEYHDKLVKLGGRPTRHVLENPAGQAIYEKDEIRIVDEHGELQITLAPNENLTVHHWKTECTLFHEQLDRWEDFRESQKTMVQVPLLKLTFDSENVDQRLIDVLVRLNDWRNFQHYQRQKVGFDLMLIRNSTQKMKEIMYEESASEEPTSSIEVQHALVNCFWDKQIFSGQMNLEASQMQLAWIEGQILEIIAEACASLAANFSLLQELEMKLEQQASNFDQELKNLEAKHACPVQYPHHSAGLAQRLCHWGSEITRLIYEYWGWKVFLRWRKTPQCTGTVASTGEQASGRQVSDLQIWRDYVSYRRHQLDRARVWVAGWQEEINFRENEINITPREHLYMLESTISGLRAKVDKFQQDVQIAELRVRLAEQQLDKLAAQHSRLGTSYSTQQSDVQSSLPLARLDSESTATILEHSTLPKDHRTTSSTVSPVTETPDSGRFSKLLKTREGVRANGHDTTKRQPITVGEAVVPDPVIADDNIQTTDAPSYPCPDAAIGDGEGAGLLHTPRTDVRDALMTDVEDLVNHCSGSASKAHSKGRSTRVKRKSPLPTHKAPTSRKTRSTKTLDQPFSSRVLKHAGKKPIRNAKASTMKKAKAILSSTSLDESPTNSPPPRRSQRLKEKVAASVSTAAT